MAGLHKMELDVEPGATVETPGGRQQLKTPLSHVSHERPVFERRCHRFQKEEFCVSNGTSGATRIRGSSTTSGRIRAGFEALSTERFP